MKAFIIISTIILVFGSDVYQKNNQDCYYNINADDFFLKVNQEEIFILDVREYKNFKKNRINGALSIPDKKTLIEFTSKIDNNSKLLIYCTKGEVSAQVCEILCKELGFSEVYNLDKGINNWIDKGYDLDKSKYKREK